MTSRGNKEVVASGPDYAGSSELNEEVHRKKKKKHKKMKDEFSEKRKKQ